MLHTLPVQHVQPQRKLRRDAAANRAKILDHAATTLASDGLSVSLHRIADELGLGIGTVYRHFPTQDHLFLAIYDRYWTLADEAYGAGFSPELGAWDRVILFVDTAIAMVFDYPAGRLVTPRVQRIFPDRIRTTVWTDTLVEAVAAAKADGLIRDDIEPSDIAVLPFLVGELNSVPEPLRPVMIQRVRALVVDAMRPAGAERTPLPGTPVVLDELLSLAPSTAEA